MRRFLLTIISLGIALMATGCQFTPAQPTATPPPIVQLPRDGLATATRIAAAPKITVVVTSSKSGVAPTSAPTPAPTPRPSIMAVGVRTALVLRDAPQANAAVVATLSGSQVIWAEARSADDRWIRVIYGDERASAWVSRADISLFGEAAALPALGPADAAIASPAPIARSLQAGMSGRVQVDQVNIRRGPGVDQDVIGVATAGQTVTVIGRSQEGDWLAIAWQGETSWLAARFITLTGDVTGLPALAAQTSRVPSQPASATGGGKIVFQTAIGGDIYILNADGSGLRRLADGIDPILSPDGVRVAFARWGSPHGVFILDLRTGQEQRVASVNRPRGPTWSPDGSRLVFTYVTRTRTCVDLGFACVDPEQVRQMLGGRDCIDTPQGRRCISDFPVVTVDDNGLAVVNLLDNGRENWISEGLVQSVQWHPHPRSDRLSRETRVARHCPRRVTRAAGQRSQYQQPRLVAGWPAHGRANARP